MSVLRRTCVPMLVLSLLAIPLFAQQEPPVNDKLQHHSNYFPKTIYNVRNDAYSSAYWAPGVKYSAYVAVGYDLANTLAIVGPTGDIVIIDTLGSQPAADEAIAAFRAAKIFPPLPQKLPIRAIIYTHNHIDHIGGVQSFVNAASRPACQPESTSSTGSDAPLFADTDCVALIGQQQIVQGVNNTATVIGRMINYRSVYMYGTFLNPPLTGTKSWVINDGIGPEERVGTSTWIAPSRTFTNAMTVTAAGVRMQLVYVPSETNDELAVFVPDASNSGTGNGGLLFSAEVIQGPSFPNLYSLRGTSYRNPATWFRSVDTLRGYNSWCMLPSHGTPVCGQQNIQTLLTNFRDAIQYTHDQSIRYMNLGYTSAELPQTIPALPPYLIRNLQSIQTARGNDTTNPEDYLTAFYGSVPQSLHELYFGYLGWFQGDPVALAPTPPTAYAARLVQMMGGRDQVLDAAKLAASSGDNQWSAELATLLVTRDPKDQSARDVKANAYMQLAGGKDLTNPNWRNWYITAAFELMNKTPTSSFSGGLTSPGIVKALPIADWVNQWTIRLKAADTIANNTNTTLGIWFVPSATTEKPSGYLMTIRMGICQISELSDINQVRAAQNGIQLTRAAANQLIDADVANAPTQFAQTLTNLMTSSPAQIPVLAGTPAGVSAFFANFDTAPTKYPPIAGR